MTTDAQPWSVPSEVVESLAESLAKGPAIPPELAALPPLPTIHQAAVALNMSDPTVRRFIADKKLVAYRVGKRSIRIDKASLINLASQPVVGD
jgi:excisionase family DNA binding protein